MTKEPNGPVPTPVPARSRSCNPAVSHNMSRMVAAHLIVAAPGRYLEEQQARSLGGSRYV